ncbi:MAG: flavodoxin family protein, partial [Firmicutes bacterium]|nr:flavodoxin family protein [Bacillota bacterium]
MKVLLINGSPHKSGCTYTALSVISDTLKENGVESDIYWIGNKPIGGCIGCFACTKKQKCVFDDKVNEFTMLALEYDGFIFGSPVYYSGMNGSLMSFMDRVF